MKNSEDILEERILKIFKELPEDRKKQGLDFAEFLIWKDKKYSSVGQEKSENENNHKS
ncbi:MAG: hypothetical protein R2747_02650 [Pyrinomonadaceae bacterium]